MKIFTEHQIHSFNYDMTHSADFASQGRRRHMRRCASMNIMCMRYGESGAQSADRCVLMNISKSGIAMQSRQIYNNGEKVVAAFIAGDDGLAVITMEIVRSRVRDYGTIYGAKYVETNPKRIEDFNAYLLKYFNLY